jgi:hypothetical protein
MGPHDDRDRREHLPALIEEGGSENGEADVDMARRFAEEEHRREKSMRDAEEKSMVSITLICFVAVDCLMVGILRLCFVMPAHAPFARNFLLDCLLVEVRKNQLPAPRPHVALMRIIWPPSSPAGTM